ncbi:MAG: HD-GYP domain-containing protein [Fidelibacterota bacterium]|nr:MAG: HD-GYP domain-containing protein [Candidatus Neomarinimicrobiota bacterium]
MLRPVKVEDLKIGMYVTLGEQAHLLPLFEENFMITSEKQIVNIIDKGLALVDVDTEKSEVDVPVIEDFDQLDTISKKFRETIEDKRTPPKEKAKAVYDHSIEMMKHVIETPTHDSILSGKQMVGDMVDLILADDETADCLTQITSHDYYTYTHSVNVGMFGVLLSKAAFSDHADHDMRELGAAFFLHDLGKCEVPSYVINKPGRLTEEEWDLMRQHPANGERILSETGHLTSECSLIVLQHHEREDGTGYPNRLSGYRIHVYAHICALADVYDALTSIRPYKKNLSVFQALKIMRDEMISHFNRDLFEKFVLLFQ